MNPLLENFFIFFPLHHRKGNKVRHFPTPPLKYVLKERLGPVPHKIHLSPTPSFFQSGKCRKKKKLCCFSQGRRPRPLWRQEGRQGADEEEGRLRHSSPPLRERSCSESLLGEVEIGYVAVIGEEPWNLFLKPDMHLQL